MNKPYKHGSDFVTDLKNQFGLLEAFRIAKEYLACSKRDTLEEKRFCDQIEIALWKLDQI